MAKTLADHKAALSFESNAVYDAVIAFLDTSIESEVDRAISYSTEGEKRIHACGRAEALKDFKDLLLMQHQESREGKYGT